MKPTGHKTWCNMPIRTLALVPPSSTAVTVKVLYKHIIMHCMRCSKYIFILDLTPEALCNMGYPSESYLELKSREISFANKLFCRYQVVSKILHRAQSTAMTVPCSLQNFKTIWQLKEILWKREISWYLSLDKFRLDIQYVHKPLYLNLLHSPSLVVIGLSVW